MTDRSFILDLSYSGMVKFSSFPERLEYLSLWKYGYESPRRFSNPFYKSKRWLSLRDDIISRDLGYDLGIPGAIIDGPAYVHHIVPLEENDILYWNEELLFNPENLITVSHKTHMQLHYKQLETDLYVPRKPGDTLLW